jgi:hypothetical protein
MPIANIKMANLGLYRKPSILATLRMAMAISTQWNVRLFGPTVGGVAICCGVDRIHCCVRSECLNNREEVCRSFLIFVKLAG